MKYARFFLALAVLFWVSAAAAQYQVPNHAVPIGRGGSVTGFKAAIPGTAGRVLTDNGAGADPTFAPLPPGPFTSYASRAAAIAATVSSNVNGIYLSGYATGDLNAATYVRLASTPSPIRAWHFQSADGAWWQLSAPIAFPGQLGAKIDATTDDTVAVQAWLDYCGQFGASCWGQPGVSSIPTGTLTLTGGANIDGLQKYTLRRTSNVVASLMDCNAQNNIFVRGLSFDTTAGFSSTSSNTIANTVQTYTVPAGLVGVAAGTNVQITANTSVAAHVNYMIGTVTSYSGTTLVVNVAGAVNGSGTFANWLIDVYPVNGDLAASNIALRFTACNSVVAENNYVTNRFYNAYDSRNGNRVTFKNNYASGYVNRGVHCAAYLVGNGSVKCTIKDNFLEGNSLSQYGINTSATDGAVAAAYVIEGNRIQNTTFQGVIIGGGVTASDVTDNSIQMAFANNGAGIISEGVAGTSGNQLPQQINIKGNTINGGLQGVLVINAFYGSVAGNNVTGCGADGLLFSGTTANPTLYITVSGNTVTGCTGNGIRLTGSGAASVTGLSVIGNTTIGSGGFGVLADSNSSSSNFSGNVSLANTGGGYSIAGGVGHVTTGGNL